MLSTKVKGLSPDRFTGQVVVGQGSLGRKNLLSAGDGEGGRGRGGGGGGGGDYVVPWSESGGVFSLSSLCLALNFALSVTELVSQAIS